MIRANEMNEAQTEARTALVAALMEWAEAFTDHPEQFRMQVTIDGIDWNLTIGATP